MRGYRAYKNKGANGDLYVSVLLSFPKICITAHPSSVHALPSSLFSLPPFKNVPRQHLYVFFPPMKPETKLERRGEVVRPRPRVRALSRRVAGTINEILNNEMI